MKIRYLTKETLEGVLCLLNEPEKSLSAAHSPLLLSADGARICDLDDPDYAVHKWTELSHVRVWYAFFREHAAAFSDKNQRRPY